MIAGPGDEDRNGDTGYVKAITYARALRNTLGLPHGHASIAFYDWGRFCLTFPSRGVEFRAKAG